MDIKFRFSHIYESRLNGKSSLDVSKINKIIKSLDKFWNDERILIEKSLKEITGLKFQEKEIICYLNSSKSFSDPMSIKIENLADMQDTLIHELIHNLLMQNSKKIDKGWKRLMLKYKKEVKLTRVHIAVHAIHFLLAKDLMTKRIPYIKNSKHPAYIKAWEIVEKETPENIVDTIFK